MFLWKIKGKEKYLICNGHKVPICIKMLSNLFRGMFDMKIKRNKREFLAGIFIDKNCLYCLILSKKMASIL